MSSAVAGDAKPDRRWIIAAGLAAVFALIRVIGTQGPSHLRWVLPLGFVSMALIPLLLLDAESRRAVGFMRPRGRGVYSLALLSGALAALACFVLGMLLFGTGADNWFVSIASSYRRMMDTAGWPPERLHLVFTLPALLFSPLGEEIFFRGYLQHALEQRFGAGRATVAECGAFALIHLCHHGLLLSATGWQLRPVSGLLWMGLMFGTAYLFAWQRRRSGSLAPAIVSHSAFNLAMNIVIFRFLWGPAS